MAFLPVAGSPFWYYELRQKLLAGAQTRYGTALTWQEQVSDDDRTVRLYVTLRAGSAVPCRAL